MKIASNVNLCSPVMVASSPTSNFSYQADHERPIPNIEPPPLSPSTAANAKLRKIPGILHRRTSIGEEFEKAIKGEVEEYDEGCKSEDSPIVMASSLGLNHIRTRSSPSPLQFSSNANAPSNLRNAMSNVMDGEEGRLPKCAIPHHYALSREQGRKAQSQSKSIRVPCAANQGLGDHHGAFTKEILSPRFQAILRVTSGRKKKGADIKSFSHELNSKGVKSYPFWRSRAFGHMEDFMTVIKEKFGRLKEEVNCDLGIFAGDLVGILEKTAKSHPHWKESLEDLLIVTRQCAKMSPSEFWLKCEAIVQNLDDRRQELSMGTLKQAHTRLLFILSRCTRLVQFQKESGYEEDRISGLHRRSDLGIYSEQIFGALNQKNLSSLNEKGADAKKNTKLYQSEENKLSDQSLNVGIDGQEIDTARSVDSTASSYRMSSWKKLPSAAEKNHRKDIDALDATSEDKLNMLLVKDEVNIGINDNAENLDTAVCPPDSKASQRQDVSWDLCATEHQVVCESYMICRICEVKIPTVHVEEHSKICTIADRCDLKGLTVNQRLERVAEVLERILESWSAKNTPKSADGGEENFEIARVSTSSIHEELNGCSPKQYSSSCPYSEDMIDCAPEVDTTLVMDDLNVLREISRETSSILAPELGKKTSSGGSLTPKSPLLTPLTSQLELLLHGQRSISEHENYQQISRLLDIARLVASVNANDYSALEYMLERLEDLKYTMQDRKVDALVVETFGRRIEKLLQDKYVQLCGQIEDEKADSANPADDDSWVEEDHTLRASPMNLSTKDRTSIEDFEIIKPISRGAFGRVFLARKRATGDLFAIKVLKKADMVRKNAVESILAERNILISARNPFVVRFFYSFTCRENLYLVMEYLNGGDLYSLLRNLGCLDEDMARVYVAEIVLALEYLHSLNVIHRDLKPDNLLISHDGHLKLTDFGLSRVGLINSTDDFSGPSVGSSGLLVDDKPKPQHLLKREHRQKHSVVGTPDYLAPEILLGMGHGATADWWSLGVILYELLVGIPPFNAEHPQQIFDNIMNQDISWPKIPEEMSHEAHDVLNKLLTANPVQRLGATGATEVKQHPFFKDINWGTLARQKAMFIPSAEGPYDTSYFMSRYVWNPDNDHIEGGSDFDDMTETGSATCSSSAFSNFPDEDGDECGSLADFCAPTLAAKYSFSNFSFKNLSQLASINYDLVVKNAQTSPETSRPEFL